MRIRLDIYPLGGVKRGGGGREVAPYATKETSQLKFTGIDI